MDTLKIALFVVLAITSILLILLVLMHKGRGGGLSDMFGGGISAGAGSSGVAERNLNILTVIVALIWVGSIIGIGVIQRFYPG
ncbi:preprotein translocase subunit SecG [Helcobacillus massiliensis]|uniref:Protein-export membrane protein SecG n=1 Tax=Helcobacillus massiliensis TaxID=521392 RepID=A0A839QRS0_9MICO|nr:MULTISPECIES: preprotein translocase subunit SecG [Helcobacillus]MBB3022368.1 preprotein translocase subunit SecG [Helcobacillus massiliensis]MCG7426988.1 preprotein translocase subunit SecG [Helcobacillus sp. ACRRO]MCT1557006.1 preprotein translocase subunit SecG [Helcobacillus massiliensis]MCT2035395.1 preprotein translocase subunit SecG [Helcobacillus massiliensis]MCT2331390.1 preprotein translocase subunit SecG [Helcobacillus massiliensis]